MITGILAAIAALGTIFGVIKYSEQIALFFAVKSPEKKDQTIDQQEEQNKQKAEDSGRPQ